MSDPRVDELAAGLKRLQQRHGHFTLQCPFSSIVTLVAQLQLALRHPGNRGEPARETRRVIDDIINTLGATEPRVAELLRLGDDPGQDVVSGGAPALARLESFLHARQMHPDYEYETTKGPRKAFDDTVPPSGKGWERNTDYGRNGWERFDYHEEAYWKRKREVVP